MHNIKGANHSYMVTLQGLLLTLIKIHSPLLFINFNKGKEFISYVRSIGYIVGFSSKACVIIGPLQLQLVAKDGGQYNSQYPVSIAMRHKCITNSNEYKSL